MTDKKNEPDGCTVLCAFLILVLTIGSVFYVIGSIRDRLDQLENKVEKLESIISTKDKP